MNWLCFFLNVKWRSLGCLFLFFSCAASAQSQLPRDFPLERSYYDPYYSSLLSVAFSPDSLEKHLFFLQGQTYSTFQGKADGFQAGLLPYQQASLQAGYAVEISPNWNLGFSGHFLRTAGREFFSGVLWASHSSHFSNGIVWEKRLAFRSRHENAKNGESEGAFLFRTGLGKRWAIGKKHLSTLLSFAAELDTGNPPENTRTVERSAWQLLLLSQPIQKLPLSLGVWASRQTNYFFAIETFRYDADGNLIEYKPDRKLNLIRFGLGLQVLWHLRGGQQVRSLQNMLSFPTP